MASYEYKLTKEQVDKLPPELQYNLVITHRKEKSEIRQAEIKQQENINQKERNDMFNSIIKNIFQTYNNAINAGKVSKWEKIGDFVLSLSKVALIGIIIYIFIYYGYMIIADKKTEEVEKLLTSFSVILYPVIILLYLGMKGAGLFSISSTIKTIFKTIQKIGKEQGDGNGNRKDNDN